MSQFKKGDKVVLVKFIDLPINEIIFGEVGTITNRDERGTYKNTVVFTKVTSTFNDEELVHEYLYNSPLMKALR